MYGKRAKHQVLLLAVSGAIGLITLGTAVFFPSRPQANAAKVHRVAIQNMKYVPQRIEVEEGEEIVWTNEDIVPHTVTEAKKSSDLGDSGLIAGSATYTRKAGPAGEFNYICAFHPTMKGTVVIKAAP